MKNIYTVKELEVQNFIFDAIKKEKRFYLSFDSDEIHICLDVIITGMINNSDTLEIYFFANNSESSISITKDCVTGLIIENENMSFDYKTGASVCFSELDGLL